ncbi:hypothetical protein SOVF_024960 [Spinacia oleracea]|nr:hypothetical protein SOVF_024960 [Spinacia oleracea]
MALELCACFSGFFWKALTSHKGMEELHLMTSSLHFLCGFELCCLLQTLWFNPLKN